MKTEEILKTVIDKYKLDDPVPFEARMVMEKSRKENLVRILKKETGGIIFISLVVSFFLWIKKFGISVSIAKSAVAVTAALIIGAGVITAAGVYTAGKIADYISDNNQKTEHIQNLKKDSGESINPEVQAVPEIISYSVAVAPVEMDDVPDKLLSEYRNQMIHELRENKGVKAAVNSYSLDNYHTSDKTLQVSIIKLDEKSKASGAESVYRISAKIISTADSRVLMYSSVTADGESTIPDSIKKLAEKISAKL